MSGSGRESRPGGRETVPNVREWLGGPQGYSRVVGRPSRMSGSGREALPDVREWLGGSPGCPGVVRRPSWVVWDPRGCPGVVGRLSQMSGVVGRPYRMSESGREALLDVW